MEVNYRKKVMYVVVGLLLFISVIFSVGTTLGKYSMTIELFETWEMEIPLDELSTFD